MSTATLTSLAMLKIKIDKGGDYLDYLNPFVLQVLADHRPAPVTTGAVKQYLLSDFGLEIPEQTTHIILKRLARKHLLTKKEGVYHITSELPDPGIAARKAEAERHIRAIIEGLIEYSKEGPNPLASHDDAVRALMSFLSEFDISCLRAYLRGTTIPSISQKRQQDVVLVGQYVLHLQQTSPERFQSFQILVQGHMLANALLCPDLANAPKSYDGVVFFLDTPLLLRWLGLEGKIKKDAIEGLVRLVRKLGGSFACFTHTRDELRSVIQGAANHLEDQNGHGEIVMEARRQGATRSDFLLLSEKIEDKLKELQVEVRPTPSYIKEFQIDESAFEGVLNEEVSYLNPRAKEYDINSVRCIYVLRKGKTPLTLEKAGAVLVTSNAGFAKAAYRYGQQYEELREVSAVITDVSLSNLAWLKAPMEAQGLPITEVLAISYAALEPSTTMWEKFLAELEKLEKQGNITARDHQILRSSPLAQEELMRLTLGEDSALNDQMVTDLLKRVTNEIKKEEIQKLHFEQNAHQQTKEELEHERETNKNIRERLYARCEQKAKRYARVAEIVVSLVIVIGSIGGFVSGSIVGLDLSYEDQLMGLILNVACVAMTILALFNILFGFTVRFLREWLEKKLLAWLLKREETVIGVTLNENHDSFL
ncbi:hypothetical protein D6779_02310 [Candidatus Parcubacteria bacterium]|nr:MAG: hypothetical protein D6779_02310 [Candidatus Parcubacteria bacterium]